MFNRPHPLHIRFGAFRRQQENSSATVHLVFRPAEHSERGKPLEHSCERAWVDVKDLRQGPCRNARKEADHPEHEALRARHTQVGRHPLRAFLQAMDDRPEDPHELQDVRQFRCSPLRQLWAAGTWSARGSYSVPLTRGHFQVSEAMTHRTLMAGRAPVIMTAEYTARVAVTRRTPVYAG